MALASMELDCGCVSECCGLCVLAAQAGRPRLNASNAAGWKYPNPNLKKVEG